MARALTDESSVCVPRLRQAVNTILQGSAADVIKRAMARIDAELVAAEHDAARSAMTDEGEADFADGAAAAASAVPSRRVGRLILQIHDKLLFEVEAGAADELRRRVRAAMVEAWPERLRVPLRVTVKQGPSWGELELVDEEETPSTG